MTAVESTLLGQINSTATLITVVSTTGLPPSTPFELVIDGGKATEETVYVQVFSAGVLNVIGGQSGRGYMGSVPQGHPAGAPVAWDEPGLPLALPGAVAAARFVGATVSGAPTSGTFATGDYVVDQTGAMWVCTAAGTPGTWVTVGLTDNPYIKAIPNNQSIFAPNTVTQITSLVLAGPAKGGMTLVSDSFVVPVAGTYAYSCLVTYQNSNNVVTQPGLYQALLAINTIGVEQIGGVNVLASQFPQIDGCGTIPTLNAGDAVSFYGIQNSAANQGTFGDGNHCWFNMWKISA